MTYKNQIPEYISNEGEQNQRIHRSILSPSNKLNHEIIYSENISFPEKLTKYFSLNENSIDALHNNYLWAANPLSFNDPFDCPLQLWIRDSFNKEVISKIVDPEITHIFSEDLKSNLNIFYNITIAGMGIICLNEYKKTNQDTIWGYYTNQEGFSITFNTEPLVKEFGQAFKIEYTENLDYFELNQNFFPQTLRWATQKKNIWMHETEWRFIFPTLRIETVKMNAFSSERKKKYPNNAIAELSLGLKFFPTENTLQKNYKTLIFISDSTKHEHHNKLLTFLSENKNIRTNHMHFTNDLNLVPRPCKIHKTGENQFHINYLH